MPDSAFNNGDKVIYGSNGLCRIEDQKKLRLTSGSPESLYYILRPVGSPASTLYVPADNEALCSRMRFVLSKEKIDKLLASSKEREMIWIDDKNERAALFHGVLANGMHEELLLMIRCLYLRKRSVAKLRKRLSGADEAVLQTAEKLVREEFSYSLGIEPADVGTYIREALEIEPEPAE